MTRTTRTRAKRRAREWWLCPRCTKRWDYYKGDTPRTLCKDYGVTLIRVREVIERKKSASRKRRS